MLVRMGVLLSLILLIASLTFANDKKKNLLPAYVLWARTVLVVMDPDSGITVTDPLANKTAREDVEKAIMKWGRFTLVLDGQTADLVIAVRKGHGKVVQPTIGGGPVNDRPVILQPRDGGIRVGGQKGHPPDGTQGAPQDTAPRPGAEVGPSEDMFVVYQGGVERSLDSTPVWRYIAKDALHSPNVPAVAEFRKIIEEAEKQQKGKP
jgi:hypothetical protein